MKNISTKIKFEGLGNTRDLGGIVTVDGRKIKKGRLIRSGALCDATPSDIAVLKDRFNVKTVLDLRMPAEIEEKPDKEIPGAKTLFFPLIDESYLGIARDEYSIESWLKAYRTSKLKPEEVFREMYLKIAFSDRSVPLFRGIFNEFLSLGDDECILWHCSAGKDRVGITTMLLLGALGVNYASITEDYFYTEKTTAKQIWTVRLFAPLKGYTGKIHRAIVVLFRAKREFIRWVIDEIVKDYGTIDNFLIERIGITREEINLLRDKYLE